MAPAGAVGPPPANAPPGPLGMPPANQPNPPQAPELPSKYLFSSTYIIFLKIRLFYLQRLRALLRDWEDTVHFIILAGVIVTSFC